MRDQEGGVRVFLKGSSFHAVNEQKGAVSYLVLF